MKKWLSALLCVCVLAAAAPAAVAAEPTFTLMVYLCGTDLESDGGMATMDLAEIQASGIPADGGLTVYVQTGGTKRWNNSVTTDGKCERWTLCEEGVQQLESLGRRNMGDADTLADFIAYGFQNFPADRYGLILWDHGAGASGGVCYDELTGDNLYNSEIYTALQKAGKSYQGRGKPFDFIGFDACLMGCYETALHLEPFADYMVASEELEPGTGWSYDKWLPRLVGEPDISTERLCRAIVDSFIETQAYDPSEYATLSVTRLEGMTELCAAVESMARSLEGQLDSGNLSGISRIRQNVRSFGEVSDYASDMVDLTTFAEVYSRYDQAGAQAVKAALAEAVVYSRHTDNLSGVSGLSILVPFSTRSEASEYLPYYTEMKLSPNYSRFVDGMISGIESGSGSAFGMFGALTPSQQSVQAAEIDWFSQYASDQQAYASDAGSLWESTYGTDMNEGNQSEFSLDMFLNTLFGSSDSAVSFNPEHDDSQTSLWGDPAQYSDTSFAADGSLGGGTTGQAQSWLETHGGTAATSASGTQAVTVNTEGGEVTLNNPFADTGSEYAYTIELSQEQLECLGKVEANLMMDVSDPDFECYVELGYVQDVVMDWNRGKVYGLFDGTWATLDGQMVCMYDQIVNERYIRSLIPATLNGSDCYLLVVFDDDNPGGAVVGATEGYTEAGVPARGMTELREGDRVVPMYELLYWDEDGEQQYEPFEGDEIIVGEDETIPFEYSQVEGDAEYLYGFCLTDIYGDSTFTDFMTLAF